MFGELFRKLFGVRHAAPVTILPPRARARLKAPPLRPHHPRAAEVRAAVARAPQGLSWRRLIAHVREQTGTGCSPKLLSRLRRGGWLLLLCVLTLNGCASGRRPERAAGWGTQTPSPILTPQEEDSLKSPDRPRLIKVRVTITAPNDLKVEAGDEVTAGATLSDRVGERARLLEQKRRLTIAARGIDAELAAAAESMRLLGRLGPRLPPSSFATELAAIRRAEAQAAADSGKLERQRQRLAVLPAAAPPGFDLGAMTEHEAARLRLAEETTGQGVAEVELARARMQAAREARAIEESRHAAESVRQTIAARSQWQQAAVARAQLAAQLTALDAQLEQLAAVRAPFAGRVERVTWEEQHDQTITVMLYLVVTGR